MEMVSFQLQNEFYELNFFHFEGIKIFQLEFNNKTL